MIPLKLLGQTLSVLVLFFGNVCFHQLYQSSDFYFRRFQNFIFPVSCMFSFHSFVFIMFTIQVDSLMTTITVLPCIIMSFEAVLAGWFIIIPIISCEIIFTIGNKVKWGLTSWRSRDIWIPANQWIGISKSIHLNQCLWTFCIYSLQV